jgi:hypothetical protein
MEVTSADSMLPPTDGTSDTLYKRIVVVFNASPATQLLPAPTGAGPLVLHPELLELQVSEGGCSGAPRVHLSVLQALGALTMTACTNIVRVSFHRVTTHALWLLGSSRAEYAQLTPAAAPAAAAGRRHPAEPGRGGHAVGRGADHRSLRGAPLAASPAPQRLRWSSSASCLLSTPFCRLVGMLCSLRFACVTAVRGWY